MEKEEKKQPRHNWRFLQDNVEADLKAAPECSENIFHHYNRNLGENPSYLMHLCEAHQQCRVIVTN